MPSRALLDRVTGICAREPEERTLRLRVLDAIRQVVGFDHHVWVCTDPATAVGTSPVADVPDVRRLPRLVRSKYATPIGRWTSLGEEAISHATATRGEPDISLVWREEWSRSAVTDVASMVLRDRHGCWAFLDLWRTAGVFTPEDLDVLTSLGPVLSEELRRRQAASFHDPAVERLPEGPVVMLLSPTLEVRAETAATFDHLRALLPTPAEAAPVPACAYNVAAQLIAREEGVDDHPASARLHLGGGQVLALHAARLGATPSADIAVTLQPADGSQRADLFARSHGLSPRETELLDLLLAGCDTRDAAAELHLSQHTVQDHLKSIFDKAGLRSRRALLAVVRGA